jgi:hypothetical protein
VYGNRDLANEDPHFGCVAGGDGDGAGGDRDQPVAAAVAAGAAGRGLHSSTFRLNLSALYGMGGCA